jgi:mono/diheme cytochrome c family protein
MTRTRLRPRHTWFAVAPAALALALAAADDRAVAGDQTPAAAAPVTAAQAAAGRDLYQARCAGCHLADLGGRYDAPALIGASFLSVWQSRPPSELANYIRAAMPPGGPALGADEAMAVTAFILAANNLGPAPAAATPPPAGSQGSQGPRLPPSAPAPPAPGQ